MSARDRILDKLRAAPAGPAPVVPDVPGWYARHTASLDSAQRVAALRKALEAVKTEVHEVTDANWTTVLLEIAAAKGLHQLLIGAATAHGEAVAALAPADLQILRYAQPVDAWQELLFDGVDAALTLARGAIAEIGSLILWPTPAEPRLMSLVPSLHFVLLDADTIHVNLFSALRTEGWHTGMPTNALLICGPSKTADIQQTLAYGAHGPRELVVLIRQSRGVSA
ncbi:MAG: lactate utilization protein C [Rhodoferax sp.]|nr:lactate utilization protein C [Rhodoferax sp.]OIP21963.1 MAG: lactate utilization protein C [Comamonadaceae bacterium CG2_30_60_41]PIW08776.1 MAG: lactate utilization protein C [Comamonadaceae bacterium CG17_big_fil_post_rev_8_21_14_2_50_60_13]PIY25036.1 MAG: lactate utilization protein C [Comamonadaceae bacterium CG_4_10_14_3_um_filter_60_75]PJC16172.1 MAG: lactate utilization protein C [Comamonadaceae bacterium CG_4_9_14_0_8_um_filter_60_18]